MTNTEVNFSFLKLFNSVKGVYKPFKAAEVDETWLENGASDRSRADWQKYLTHYEKIGVKHPKVKYPVMFGQGDNRYPGMLATEDIKPGEVIIEVPGREIINTKVAFYSELNHIFYENPDVFGKHLSDGEDMMLYAFVLHEIQKGTKSKYYEMIRMWPKDTDILLNWDEEDLEYLQDPTLMLEAEKQYGDLMESWNTLYKVLVLHPDIFKP